MTYDPNESENEKHRRSIRLPKYDYAGRGSYFITICVQNRERILGHILSGEVFLSRLGVIADVLWHEIPNHFENVKIHAFVAMPNHIHGVFQITEYQGTPMPKNRFQNPGKNTVSSIVGAYKASVSRHAHRLGMEFAWQRNYYEHVIRDAEDWERIINYIKDNPINWEKDSLNS